MSEINYNPLDRCPICGAFKGSLVPCRCMDYAKQDLAKTVEEKKQEFQRILDERREQIRKKEQEEEQMQKVADKVGFPFVTVTVPAKNPRAEGLLLTLLAMVDPQHAEVAGAHAREILEALRK